MDRRNLLVQELVALASAVPAARQRHAENLADIILGVEPTSATEATWPVGHEPVRQKSSTTERKNIDWSRGQNALANQTPPPDIADKIKDLGSQPSQAHLQCEQAWLDTLAHFKAPRPSRTLSYQEKVQIAESIRKNGAPMTQAALIGRRFEKKQYDMNQNVKFDPADHLKIARTFESDKFDGFANAAAREKAKQS